MLLVLDELSKWRNEDPGEFDIDGVKIVYITFDYLVAQKPRWERFLFCYDKVFKAMMGLDLIDGQSMRSILGIFLMSFQV